MCIYLFLHKSTSRCSPRPYIENIKGHVFFAQCLYCRHPSHAVRRILSPGSSGRPKTPPPPIIEELDLFASDGEAVRVSMMEMKSRVRLLLLLRLLLLILLLLLLLRLLMLY